MLLVSEAAFDVVDQVCSKSPKLIACGAVARSAIGSRPAPNDRRAFRARIRASVSEMELAPPNPISRRCPPLTLTKTQERVPLDRTRRSRPSPSECIPGVLIDGKLQARSLRLVRFTQGLPVFCEPRNQSVFLKSS